MKFELPPTRETIKTLFNELNLHLPASKAIECILHCRGNLMEESDPEEFKVDKLYEWFNINLRTLKHINEDLADP